ncbi:MAG: acyl-CoA dehydrogenase family protein [Acidimicrobiales bacterium]|nr:acyl-CoA dehydrogenase family protein [Acidimicrobiales bacterium]
MTEVRLSGAQRLLVDTCARLAQRWRSHPPAPGLAPAHDAGAWGAVVGAGLVAMRAPEELGGADATAVDVALVVEQLARGPVAVPYLGTVVALELALLARADEAVAAIVAGHAHGVVVDDGLAAFAERGTAVDAVPGDPVVGWRTGSHDAVGLVLGTAGEALDGVDPTRATARADLVAGDPIGHPLDPSARRRAEAHALTWLSADLLGAMHAALDLAVAHARDRHQFGRPIGSFQAVQHLCAEALVSVESARSITWYAAWAADDEGPDEALAAARVAKAHCARVGLEVAEAALQVWGGLGQTWECPGHLFQRRALLAGRLLGDERHQLGRIAEALVGGAAR